MITNNIIRFLQTEESVILNRLGKFSKKTIPSIVEKDTILPPKVILEFEFIEDGSGFPIVDKISKWEFIRLLDADDAVNKWVSDLRESIQNNKSVVFENFGTFYLNDSKKISFESAVIKELNAEYLGMNPVPLTKSEKAKKPTVPIVNPAEMIESEPIVEEVAAVVPEPIIEPIIEEVLDVVPEPIIEPIVEEVAAVVPEPIIEPIIEEVATVVPEPEEEIIKHKSFADAPRTEAVLDPKEHVLTGMIHPEKSHDLVIEEDEILKIDPVIEEPIEEENQIDEETEIPRKKKRSWVGTLLFIIVILGAIAVILLLFKDPILNFYHSKINPTQVETPVVTPAIPAETQQSEQYINEVDSNQVVPQEIPVVTPTPVAVEPAKTVPTQNNNVKGTYPLVPMEKGKFYVIAGSFTKENDAITHIKDKKLGQYNPILVTGQSRIRVCIGTFATEAEALAFAMKVDKTFWVLK